MTYPYMNLPRDFALDDNAAALPGALLYVYDAGTTTPRTIYSNAAGSAMHTNPLVADAAGRFATWFLNPDGGDYKITLKDSDGVTIYTVDNLPVTPITATAETTPTAPSTPVESATSSFTLGVNDVSKVWNIDPTSGDVTVTLTAATGVDDGLWTLIRHKGTAGRVIITDGTPNKIRRVLDVPGESVVLVSDNVNWYTIAETGELRVSAQGDILVADRTATPPTAPTAGTRYLATSGAASPWTATYVYEATGLGTWIEHIPATGWACYVQDENLRTVFNGSTWVDYSNVTAPTTSVLKSARYELQATNGTGGGTPSAAAWTNDTLAGWTEITNTTSTVTMATGVFTLAAGTYLICATRSFYNCNDAQIRFKSTTTSTALTSHSIYLNNGSTVGGTVSYVEPLTLASSEAFSPQYLAGFAAANGLGLANGSLSETERYGTLTIIDMTSVQGPQGIQGSNGSGYGGTSTSSVAIGSSGTKTWTTQSGYAYVTGQRVRVSYDASNYIEGTVSSYSGTTFSITADRSVGSGTYTSWTIGVAGDYGPTGPTGAAGAAGAAGATGPNTGLDYAFNTATSGDPGSGKLLYSSVTLASITTINISKTGRNGESLGGYLTTWDDSTNANHKGHLRVFTVADRTKFIEFEITGSPTDNTTYYTFPVSYSAGGTLHANTDVLAVMYERTGNAGSSGEFATVASVAALKALVGGSYTAVRTTGYTSAGDGGGLDFRWDSSSTATDDGGTIIIPNAGGAGRWKAVLEPGQRLTPHHFGCVGDNSTDDTVNLLKWSAHMTTGAWRTYGAKAGATYLFYTSGTASSGAKLIDLTGINGLDFDFAGAAFRCNYAGNFLTTLIKLTNCARARILNLTGTYDRGLPPSNPTWGMQWVQPFGCDDLVVTGCSLDGGAIGIAFGRGPGGSNNRSKRPLVTGKFRRVFYPVTWQADGDGGGRAVLDVQGAGRGALVQNVNGLDLTLDCSDVILDVLDTGPTYSSGDVNGIENFTARIRADRAGVSGGTAKSASPSVGTYNMTVTGHGYGSAGDPVLLYLSASANPTPLATATIYICNVVDANTISFQADQVAGALAAFSSAGTSVTVQRVFSQLVDVSAQTNSASCRYSNVLIESTSDSRGCVATGALFASSTYAGGSLGDGTGVDINGLTLRMEHRGDTVSGIPSVSLFEAANGWSSASPNIYCSLELRGPEITRSIGVGPYVRAVKRNIKTTLEDVLERWTGSSGSTAVDRTGKLFFDTVGGYTSNGWTVGNGASAFAIASSGGQDIQYNHNADLRQAVRRSGDITPTALAANTDNWAPTSGTTASVWRISASAAYNLTGIANGSDGTEVILHNVGSFTITLKHDTTSTAANRFSLPGSADLALGAGQSVALWYDATSSRWRSVGGSGSGSVSGAALTKTDDTNVTLTLGGSPTTALLAAASVTAGWTGQLAVGRGGTGIASGTSGGVPYFSGSTTIASSGALTANKVIKGGGAGAAPVASSVDIDASNNLTVPGSTITVQSTGNQAYLVLNTNNVSASILDGRFVTNYSSSGHMEVQKSTDGSVWATIVDYDLVNSRMGVAKANPSYTIDSAGDISSDGVFRKGGTQVLGARKTGWSVATGTATRTSFDTTTVTLPQLAERLKALIDDLHQTAGHGVIGT